MAQPVSTGTVVSDGLDGTGGKKPNQVMPEGKGRDFDSGGCTWYVTLDTPRGQEGAPPETKSHARLAEGFEYSPHLVAAAGGTAVQFRAYVDGAHTANSRYARCELREMEKDGRTKAGWSISEGSHVMEAEFALYHTLKEMPEMVCGQIHGDQTEVIAFFRYRAGRGIGWQWGKAEVHYPDRDNYPEQGKYVKIRLEAVNGIVKGFINGELIFERPDDRSGCYFKLGAYLQSSPTLDHEDPNAYGQMLVRYVKVTHESG